jgi:hypothetical protein
VTTYPQTRDEIASNYDPAVNDYDLAKDPRCCYGWGPPERGCTHMFGHACFRALGHPGECWDAGDRPRPKADRLRCDTARRPKDWDATGRAEANR